MSAKQTLPDQHLLLHERWPSDCCLCHHEGAITRLMVENERLRLELISCQVFLTAPATKAERTAKKRSIAAALKEPE